MGGVGGVPGGGGEDWQEKRWRHRWDNKYVKGYGPDGDGPFGGMWTVMSPDTSPRHIPMPQPAMLPHPAMRYEPPAQHWETVRERLPEIRTGFHSDLEA